MVHREVVQGILLVIAALTIIVEFIGFFSPGWLCLSAKYFDGIHGDSDMLIADDNSDMWDNADGVRRQDPAVAPSRIPARQKGGTNGSSTLQNNRTFVPSARQEERVFKDFLRWTKKSHFTEEESIPNNLTEFKNWVFKDKDTFITVRGYFNQFTKDMTFSGQDTPLLYFRVIQYWLRGGADDSNYPNVLEDLPHANDKADVSEFTKAMIYKDFKMFMNRTVQQQLPGDYNSFVQWLSQDIDRIKMMEIRYDYFYRMVFKKYQSDKVDVYQTVIESWFEQALENNESVDGSPSGWFDPLTLLGNMEVKVTLGLWYGRECFQDHCSGTDASRLQENGIDVGGVSTWNDIRVETMFALCACAVGFVGTLLTVKPFCLKDRRRATTIVGVIGLVLSCILFLVPITRVSSIAHALKNSGMHEDEVIQVDMPWAAAVSGIGACLALITSGFLVFLTWSDERHKWNKFEEDPAIVFKNDDKKMDEGQTVDEKDQSGAYDNIATMTEK